MKLTRIFLLLGLFWLVAGCGQEAEPEPLVTPPVVEVTTAVSETAPPAEPTAVSEAAPTEAAPEQPTPQPTAIPQPEPTATPQPVSLASQIQLAEILPAGQLVRPVYLTHANDERMFIVEQAGTIRIMQDGQLRETPFLDIVDRVNSNANEQGLLSVAFHPVYAENGRFFINYTRSDGATVVSRYQVSNDPNVADPTSETVLLTIPQPYGNHNGGLVKFGPDGFLYIGMGDGGSAGDPENNGQDYGTLLGSMLRIDVDNGELYAVPGSNPFVGNDAIRNEIWAGGLRNPWRFSFDRLTGDLFIGDVGQREWEEVSFQAASSPGGENYGWNILEGDVCYISANCQPDNTVLPIFTYTHSQGCSITGGYVYRGASYPALYGNYLAADYCNGNIWAMVPQADGGWQSALIAGTGIQISSFGEDVNGELYVMNHANGAIYRLEG